MPIEPTNNDARSSGSERLAAQSNIINEWSLVEPPGPAWMRNLIGIDYFASVYKVDVDVENADIAPLANLTTLRTLSLDGTQVRDLAPLANLTNMRELFLSDTNVRDVAPLTKLPKRNWLGLGNTQVRTTIKCSRRRCRIVTSGGAKPTECREACRRHPKQMARRQAEMATTLALFFNRGA